MPGDLFDLLAAPKTPLSRIARAARRGLDRLGPDESSLWVWAARHGRLDAMRCFARLGAPLGSVDREGWSAAHWLGFEARVDGLAFLRTLHEDLDRLDRGGRSPLAWACAEGHPAVVEFLARHGADIERVDGDGLTCLMLAASRGHPASLLALAGAGADLAGRGRHGRQALHGALDAQDDMLFEIAGKGRQACLRELIALGAPLDGADFDGFTPAMLAASFGLFEPLRLLVQAGANLRCLDRQGRSALDHAQGPCAALIESALCRRALDQHLARAAGEGASRL